MRKFTLFAVLACVTILAAMLPASALAASQECKIVNQTSDEKFDNLQAAVNAATPGDTLKLKGTCVGATTVTKALTISGHSNPAYGPATLDAQGAFAPTLTVRSFGGDVTIEGLTITGGSGLFGTLGGGILGYFCGCNITVNDSTITGNGNTGSGSGGGIFAFASGLTLNNTTVSGNVARSAGGIGAGFNGIYAITLNNSTISDNQSIDNGGGITTQSCTVTLNNSQVSDNTAGLNGGGINALNSTYTLNGSTVSGNTAGQFGGGIYNGNSTLAIDGGSSVAGNAPDDIYTAP